MLWLWEIFCCNYEIINAKLYWQLPSSNSSSLLQWQTVSACLWEVLERRSRMTQTTTGRRSRGLMALQTNYWLIGWGCMCGSWRRFCIGRDVSCWEGSGGGSLNNCQFRGRWKRECLCFECWSAWNSILTSAQVAVHVHLHRFASPATWLMPTV